jgi:hypothetical protein
VLGKTRPVTFVLSRDVPKRAALALEKLLSSLEAEQVAPYFPVEPVEHALSIARQEATSQPTTAYGTAPMRSQVLSTYFAVSKVVDRVKFALIDSFRECHENTSIDEQLVHSP